MAGPRQAGLGRSAALVLGAAAAVAVYLVSAPLVMLVVTALRGPGDWLPFEPGARWSLEHVRAVYADPALYLDIVPDTLAFVVGSVAVAFSIGFALAWIVERTDVPGRDAAYALILFPLLIPTVVLGVAWISLFGPNAGWVNLAIRSVTGSTGSGPLDVFSLPGLIVCQGLAMVPFVFLLLSATLRSMNPALEEASLASGASGLTTFRRVTVPVLRPGILAPLILTTLVTLEQFEMPLLVGLPARINVFSTRIFHELNPDSGLPLYGRAAAVALPFLAVGVALLLAYNRAIRRSDRFATVTGRGYRPVRVRLGAWRWPSLLLVVGYVGAASVLPAAMLVWTSLFGYRTPSWSVLGDASLEAYASLLGDALFYRAVGNTFLVAGASAVLVTALGLALAWIVARTRVPGRSVLDVISFVSVGIPSVIAGLAVMLLYLTLPVALYGTVWILVVAYSYRLAVTTRLGRAGLAQIHPELEEAAAVAGGGWSQTVRRVVMPLLAPSLVTSLVLLFIIGFREFTLPLVLASPDNMVLSVLLWRFFEDGDGARAAAVATIIMILVFPLIALGRRAALGRLWAGQA